MKQYPTLRLSVLIALMSLANCKNSENKPSLNVVVENSVSGNPTIETITPVGYPTDLAPEQEEFDWEALENIPLPSTANTVIPMPWSGNVKRGFSSDIRYDIKKEDGWVLYISTFSTKLNSAEKSLVLYNKYSGIFRYYYYVRGDVSNVKDYKILMHSLATFGSHAAASPILNFAQQEIVDVDVNSTISKTIEPWPIADSTWLALEYELAFDKQVYNQSSNSFILDCAYSMIKKVSLTLNSNQLDNLNTKIRLSYGEYQFGNTYSGDARIVLYGLADFNQVDNVLSNSDFVLLSETINQQSFGNILNGVMNYSSKGNMEWTANLSFTSGPSSVGLGNNTMYISGANNSVVQGLNSFYTKALGVFYLNDKPKVNFSNVLVDTHPFQYELNVNSVKYIFNPSVTEIADIENLTQELVATQNNELFENNGRTKLFVGQKLSSNLPLIIQGVRVSFDVVPKDGGKTVHIVKTFKPEIVSQE